MNRIEECLITESTGENLLNDIGSSYVNPFIRFFYNYLFRFDNITT